MSQVDDLITRLEDLSVEPNGLQVTDGGDRLVSNDRLGHEHNTTLEGMDEVLDSLREVCSLLISIYNLTDA
jgi:hypothetical protein